MSYIEFVSCHDSRINTYIHSSLSIPELDEMSSVYFVNIAPSVVTLRCTLHEMKSYVENQSIVID